MQIHELNELSIWYAENVTKSKIENFINTIINRIKNRVSLTDSAFINDKASLLSAVERIDSSSLTTNQRKCLVKMNISSILLEGAIEELKMLFDMSGNDTNYVLTTLERYSKSLKAASQAMTQLRASASVIVPDEYLFSKPVPEGKVLTRLTFQNDASINNFVEFSDWGKRWNLIARGFSMAVNEPIEDFEIVNADRGSLIVDILVGAKAMQILFESLKSLTELAISVTELRIKHKELNGLKETVSKELFDQFVEQSNASIEKKEDELVEKVIAKLNKEGLIKNDTAHNDISRAIKEIHRFNAHGGSLESVASNDDSFNADVVRELNESYKLLQTEAEIKLIQDKKTDG